MPHESERAYFLSFDHMGAPDRSVCLLASRGSDGTLVIHRFLTLRVDEHVPSVAGTVRLTPAEFQALDTARDVVARTGGRSW